MSDKKLPTKLFGYDVHSYLGEGAASHLYVVTEPGSDVRLALKHVVRETDKHERFIEQLETEYEVGKRVRHPALRKSLDMQSHRSLLRRQIVEAALILELVKGKPVDKQKPGPLAEVIACFVEVARGLETLHYIGYVHCDMKPENVLMDGVGHVKLIDFGQACLPGTVKTRIQGSADYMSPEQVRCEPISFKTDVYNFAATLYRMAAGQAMPTLYTAKRGESRKSLEKRIPPAHVVNPKVPEALSKLIMESVRSDPEKRPSMREVSDRLGEVKQSLGGVVGAAAPGASHPPRGQSER